MSRFPHIITLEKINGHTKITEQKNGNVRTLTSTENRSLKIVDKPKRYGVKIMPHDNEKELNNFFIPIHALAGFNGNTAESLLKHILDKGFFKKGVGVGKDELPVFKSVENEYATIAEMLQKQREQTLSSIQYVADATLDNHVEKSWAYYEKLATNTKEIADYRLLSEEQIAYLVSVPTKTSDLQNNGDGNSPFVDKEALDKKLNIEDLKLINASNLIIGGIGTKINNKELLARKFTFSEDDIANMLVINNNVYATITNESYTFTTFANNTDITSIEEKDGFLKTINTNGVFMNCSNLKSVKLKIKKARIMHNFVNNCVSLSPSKLYLNELEVVENAIYPFCNLKDDDSILRLPRLKKALNSLRWFRGDNRLKVDFPLLREIKGGLFAYSTNLSFINLPSLEVCGDTVDAVGSEWNYGDSVFFAMNKSSSSTLSLIHINLNRKLQTVNDGKPDTDVKYLMLGEIPALGLPSVGGNNRVPVQVSWVGQNPFLELQDGNGFTKILLDMPSKLRLKGGVFNSSMKAWELPFATPIDETTISNPKKGMIVFSSVDNKHKGFDGIKWNNLY